MRTKILLAFLLAALEITAQNTTKAKSDNTTSYSAGSGEDLSRLAGHLLDDTNRARAALKNGDRQDAMQDVKQAQNYLYRISELAPGVAMVPVYQEFVSVSILAPVDLEHKARKAEEAKEEGQSNAAQPTAVKEVAGQYTHVLMSTAVARISLEDARDALLKGDVKTADAALADVQEGVEIESVESDMPLSRARENLILARAAVRHDRYPEAKASLEAACNALKNYAKQGGQHADQAKSLEKQVNELAANIQQNHAEAVSKISSWWRMTSSWSPYKSAQSQG